MKEQQPHAIPVRDQQSTDRFLFTPGPLTTSHSIKAAMLHDFGSLETEFLNIVQRVRLGLLDVAGVSTTTGYETILLQGSGTYSVESVISSCIPAGGKLLLIINGAYGERMLKIAGIHDIETFVLHYPENLPPNIEDLEKALQDHPDTMMVAVVHCETSSGVMNPIEEIGRVVRRYGKVYFVDSMSAFGAVPIDFMACQIDYLASSANKCIEGVPGLSFVICRRETLLASAGWARTLSFDLVDQWQGLETNGQFRFTPPTHVLLALEQALEELQEEGGVPGRAARYRANYETLMAGMEGLGFEPYVAPKYRGYIITSFYCPCHPNFRFDQFYALLSERGFVIYPGKVTNADCFRIGTIGRIDRSDIDALLGAISEVLHIMQIELGDLKTFANR